MKNRYVNSILNIYKPLIVSSIQYDLLETILVKIGTYCDNFEAENIIQPISNDDNILKISVRNLFNRNKSLYLHVYDNKFDIQYVNDLGALSPSTTVYYNEILNDKSSTFKWILNIYFDEK